MHTMYSKVLQAFKNVLDMVEQDKSSLSNRPEIAQAHELIKQASASYGGSEPIKTTINPDGQEVESHPSFASIRIVRTQSSGGTLFGSEFTHQHMIRIEVMAAEDIVENGYKRVMPLHSEPILTILMSQDQYGNALGSMGLGEGTRCTINRHMGQSVPAIAKGKSAYTRFQEQAKSSIDGAVAGIDKALADLPVSMKGASKKAVDTVRESLNAAKREVAQNVPFLASQFEQHMEQTMLKAQAELYGLQAAMALPTAVVPQLADHSEKG